MASLFMSSAKLLLLLALLSSMSPLPSHAFKFEVGDAAGWVVPSSKDTELYNHWASRNRFQVGDTVHFKYKKDSVMEVSEDDYESCRSSHPLYFSNNGKTEFTLDRPGMFYFISGVTGHCEKGQRMIIRVMSHAEGPSTSLPAGNQTGTSEGPGSPNPSSAAWGAAWVPALASREAQVLLVAPLFFWFWA